MASTAVPAVKATMLTALVSTKCTKSSSSGSSVVCDSSRARRISAVEGRGTPAARQASTRDEAGTEGGGGKGRGAIGTVWRRGGPGALDGAASGVVTGVTGGSMRQRTDDAGLTYGQRPNPRTNTKK